VKKKLQRMKKNDLIQQIIELRNIVELKEEEIKVLKTPSKIDDKVLTSSEDIYKIVSNLTSDFAYAFRINEQNKLEYEWGFGALEKITGYTRQELSDAGGWETLIYKDDVKIAFDQFNKILQGESDTSEYRIKDKRGNIYWILDYAKPIKNKVTGKVEYIYGAIQDITKRKKAEQKLLFANLVLEDSPAVLFRWRADKGWPVEYVSNNIRQFGYSPNELISGDIPYSNIIYADDLERVKKEVEEYSSNRIDNFRQEYRIITKDGRICWTDDRTQVERDDDGKIIFYRGITLDITETKLAQVSLKENEERLRLALNSANQVTWELNLITGDVNVGKEYPKMLGYDHQKFKETKEKWIRRVHPEDKEKVILDLKESISGEIDEYRSEMRLKTKSKKWVWILSVGKVVERDSFGNPIRMLGTYTDISKTKKYDDTIRESEERLRLALTSANQGLYDLNIQTGKAIVSNEYATMLGYDPKSFSESNNKWINRLHHKDLERVKRNYQDYITNKIPEYRIEFRQKTKSNKWIWIQSSGKIVEWDNKGKPLRMLGIHTDITEKKSTEFALRESEQQYKLLFSDNPNPMFVFDKKSLGFLNANEAAVKQYGYTLEEFLSMTIKDIRPKEDIPEMQKVINGLNSEISTAKGYRHKRKNGEIIHVDVTANSTKFDGRDSQVVVVYDITGD